MNKAQETHYRNLIIKYGFLSKEADAFIHAKAPDGNPQDFEAIFKSAPFQSMLKSRANWVTSVRRLGWSSQKVAASISHYYKLKSGRSPFDFLKIEYRPPKQLSDYAFAIKVRAKARIARMSKRTFGVRYTKPLAKEWRPRETLDVRPKLAEA